jgi:hypothetical protein
VKSWIPTYAVLFSLASGTAWARSEKSLGYARDQVWPAAVRFLVVDEHLAITDKDPDAGYVLFELREDGKTFRGALELISVVEDKRPRLKLVLQIDDRPDWVELAMLTRLERKLRAELGSPSPAPTKPKPDPKDPPKSDDGGPPVSPTP